MNTTFIIFLYPKTGIVASQIKSETLRPGARKHIMIESNFVEQVFNVLEITIPVFAMIGLGRWLTVKNIMTTDHRLFMNKIIFYFSLPALIFIGISGTDFDKLISMPIIVGGTVPMLIITALAILSTLIFKIDKSIRGPFIYTGFWANATYLGFPLAQRAFGDEGFTNAAIFNAFAVPLWITAGTLITGVYGDKKSSVSKMLKTAIVNPIVGAAFFGIICAYISQNISQDSIRILNPPVSMITGFLKLGGSMGLPMALLAIGGSLSFRAVSQNKMALFAACSLKVVVTPMITLLILKSFFPDASKIVVGSCVLLMATPVAVASYVIATGAHIKEEPAAAVIVWTTLASIVTIPVWLFFLI